MIRFIMAIMLVILPPLAFAFDSYLTPPSSVWKIKEAYTNFQLFQKETESTYVQVVDIKSGAKVRSVVFPVTPNSTSTKFYTKSIDEMWDAATSGRLSVFNGQFFAYWDLPNLFPYNPTTLAYDVKSNSNVLVYGYGDDLAKKQVEIFDNSGVSVYSYDRKRIDTGLSTSSKAQNIIVGLDPSVDKSKTSSIGRMYMCAKDINYLYPKTPKPWLVVYHSSKKTQSQAYSDINSWGCASGSIVMFDGSGSAQLKTKGKGKIVVDSRKLPHTLSISNN